MRKQLPILLSALFFLSCSNGNKNYLFLDEEHKSFYVNGVSAIEGYVAIVQSLEELDFTMGNIETVDGSIFNQPVTNYAVLKSNHQCSREEFDRLTNGLFVNLPSGDAILEEANNNGYSVYLSWYPSGIVNAASIQISRSQNESDAAQINKRLASIFPKSKVGNKTFGYRTYYSDDGIQVYYTNDYFICIEKK